ncbi:glycosyltransferase [Collinsella intestinalis]|uniref:glycosyltransferase n=1 Tax=Collinsella intestinalis TaxID=147207 RepID=UPI0019573B4F
MPQPIETEYISIPKIIHYCWFGGGSFGDKETACIESWQKYLPDYEIRRWDETNFDITCCDYVEEAYEARKWAFVSDFARFQILYEYGGLYFDTDVELVKPINDIVERGAFMGMEEDCSTEGNGGEDSAIKVNPGVGLGTPPGAELFAAILDSYKSAHFISPAGDNDETTVVERVTAFLWERGLRNVIGIQKVAGFYLYPAEYFCPLDFDSGELNITSNTRSIHWYGATWLSPSQKLELRVKRALIRHGVSKRTAQAASSMIAIICCFDIDRVRRRIHKVRG